MGTSRVAQVERELLLELAEGKKTFEQVGADARKACRVARAGAGPIALTGSNPARCITSRLKELTSISTDSLNYFEVRCSPSAADPALGGTKMRLPFILLSTHIEQLLSKDGSYFEVEMQEQPADVAASDFVHSREYVNHALVQACWPLGETVVPTGLYSDGVSVGCDPHKDSLYVIYLYFLHRPPHEAGRPESKFVFTIYRKSEATKETMNDIWRILLWELQALQHGRKPLLGQEALALEDQQAGEYLGDRWGRWHRVALFQIKGDWAWYCESMAVWQWNSAAHMCPFCSAHGRGALTWRDFSLDAPWRSTCRTHTKFLEDMRASKSQRFRRGLSAFKGESLLTLAPFFAWTMLKLDWMHAADLGVLVYVLGSVWWSLLPALASPRGRPTTAVRETGLSALKDRLKTYYRDRKVSNKLPLKRLTLGKVKAKCGPKLKAKAAQAKDLLRFTVELAEEFKDDGSPICAQRCQMMSELASMYALAQKHSATADELMAWRAHAASFAYFYAACGFKMYPKMHYLMHIPEQVEQGGVLRSFWCYSEESKNRQLKRLFGVCSKGHSLHQQILLRLQWWHALLELD